MQGLDHERSTGPDVANLSGIRGAIGADVDYGVPDHKTMISAPIRRTTEGSQWPDRYRSPINGLTTRTLP